MGLVADVVDEVSDTPVDDVRLGVRYSCARVGERIGVAFSMFEGCDPPARVGKLRGERLARLALSENLMEATLGTAAINAQLSPDAFTEANAFDIILDRAGEFERAAVVGLFPFVNDLRERVREVHVFERREVPGCLPEGKEDELIPTCDLVVITGTSFVNKTMERLLGMSKGHTMVIGPTTPMSRALFDYGADLIAGVVIDDARVVDIVSQGGGTREFMPLAKAIVMER